VEKLSETLEILKTSLLFTVTTEKSNRITLLFQWHSTTFVSYAALYSAKHKDILNVLRIAVSFVQYEPHGHPERSWDIASFCMVQKRTDNYTSFVPSTDTSKTQSGFETRFRLWCNWFYKETEW